MLPTDLVPRIVLNLVPMVLSLSVHEFSHAWVADRLGDDTPRREGRPASGCVNRTRIPIAASL